MLGSKGAGYESSNAVVDGGAAGAGWCPSAGWITFFLCPVVPVRSREPVVLSASIISGTGLHSCRCFIASRIAAFFFSIAATSISLFFLSSATCLVSSLLRASGWSCRCHRPSRLSLASVDIAGSFGGFNLFVFDALFAFQQPHPCNRDRCSSIQHGVR